MSGETYVQRYPGGFVDLPAQTTAIDSQFLNAVESALVRLLGEDPANGEVGVWSSASGRLIYQLLTNAQVAPGAAVSRAKLDFGVGLVDADIAPGAAISSSKISGLTGGQIPAGVMVPYGAASPPTGWLLCDGSAVSRATYAGIFSVIAVIYGAGDGTTTFNLPDFRGRVAVMLGTHADVGALGANDGQAVGTRRLKHAHAAAGLTFTGTGGTTGTDSPDHAHGGVARTPFANYKSYTGVGSDTGPSSVASATDGANARHAHGFTPAGTIGGTVGPAGMTDSPAYLVANMIIKT